MQDNRMQVVSTAVLKWDFMKKPMASLRSLSLFFLRFGIARLLLLAAQELRRAVQAGSKLFGGACLHLRGFLGRFC